MNTSLRLKKKPDWDNIEEVRTESSQFLTTNKFSDEESHSLIMVISELMENGIKYGDYSIVDSVVEILIDIKKTIVEIEVLNPVKDAEKKHLQKLDKTIQWIRGYQDPFEAFIEKLRNVSKKPLNDMESGLGLVRIAYEGRAVLDFFVGEDNRLNVSAIVDRENIKRINHG